MTNDIDWPEIAHVYEYIADQLRGINLITPADLEQHTLHQLTYGLVQSQLLKTLSADRLAFIGTPDLSDDQLLNELALNFSTAIGSSDKFPNFIREHFDRGQADQSVIEEAIDTKQVTTQFMMAWARLNTFHGAVLALRDRKPSEQYLSAAAGSLQGIEIQKYWYAHWLAAHPKTRDNLEPGHGFVSLCQQIRKRVLKPWAPYPADWFKRALNKTGYDVTSGLLRMGPEELRQRREHKIITVAVLPPLSADKFQRM